MKLSELAEKIRCQLNGDGEIEISSVMPIEEAGPGSVTFVANPQYQPLLKETKASAVIVAIDEIEVSTPTLRCDDPYLAFAQAVELFHQPLTMPEGIDPRASISESATLGKNCSVGAFAVISDDVRIGDNARIDPHVVIYPNTKIGNDFRAYSHVTIRESVIIGDRVILQPGSVIGADGFGYVLGDDGKATKISQAGIVEIGNDVEIGANTTIDRAAIGATTLADGVKIDNLVMIAHGCSIGEGSAIAGQSGLAGSTKIGRFVRFGGQVGTAGHLKIGDGVQAAAKTGIPSDVEAGKIIGGYPAQDIQSWRRSVAIMPKLSKVLRRLRRLEKHLEVEE